LRTPGKKAMSLENFPGEILFLLKTRNGREWPADCQWENLFPSAKNFEKQ
jgi:hypothetical protein